ncbi:type IV secretion system protein [Lysinibacillus sp. UGB7]|uniref:type IV secretion system protein n=1 Tax=Lysinibacillus sp. UGB7 TaxID=3411039 RepID=UPI003B797160
MSIFKKENKLKVHEDRIIKDLFTSNGLEAPRILYGEEAKAFVIKEAIDGQMFLKKKTNGCFIRDFKEESAVSDKDRKTGVVYLFNKRLATLAHELRHSYQWQTDKSLFPNNNKDKEIYKKNMNAINKKGYYNVPAEKDAFTYAMQYLNTHSGLLQGFLKRWTYRFDILSVKNYLLTVVMFVGMICLMYVLAFNLPIAASFEMGVAFMIGFLMIVWLLSHGICRVLMDKEHFLKLK